jgi:hypothetical protein
MANHEMEEERKVAEKGNLWNHTAFGDTKPENFKNCSFL